MTPLRVLIVEDSESDAKLILRELRRTDRDVEYERVEDADAMRSALARSSWDVILADWSMPRFSAPLALEILEESGLDTPFIIVSGTIGEETAVEALRAGAHDFLIKDRLGRLAAAVEREIREARIRAAREQSERSKAAILDVSPDAIIGIDHLGLVSEFNPAAARMFGYTRDQALGRRFPDLLAPFSSREAFGGGLQGSIVGKRVELSALRRDGSEFPVELAVTRVGSKEPASYIGFARDISERRRAEEALHASEVRFRRLAESGIIAIAVADVMGRVLEVNEAHVRMLGYSREDVQAGKVRWPDITPPEWRGADERAAEALRTGGAASPWEKELFHKDGKRVPVLIGAAMLEHPKVICFLLDLTERKRAEESSTLLQSIALAVSETDDLELALQTVVRKVCEATGWTLGAAWVPQPDGARLRCAATWSGGGPGDERRRALVEGRTFAAGEGLLGEAWSSREPEWIRDLAAIPGPRAALARSLGIHAAVHIRVVVEDEVAAVLEWGLDRPRDEDEASLRLVTSVAAQLGSVIQRKQAQGALRHTEEQLRQAVKMEGIGQLAGGIAHDFNNMLSVILSHSSFLLDALGPNDPRWEDADAIRSAGERGAGLVRQLLAVSRRQLLEPRVIDLNAVVTGLEKMLHRLIREDIELAARLSPDIGRVKADPGQIEQVIMNLVVNARDAMPDGGKLCIETANVEFSQGSTHLPVQPGPYVLLAVTDTGIGMDADTQRRAFEPFFTTKGGHGTGLGLSTCYGIVKQSGGYIWVDSEPGRGAAFKVYLPRVQGETETLPERRPPLDLRGSETVLLVEDDERVRAAARKILESNGYTVMAARDAPEALEVAQARHGSIDLAIADVVMPGMSGPDLIERLEKLVPGLRVLFMSGHMDGSRFGSDVKPGINLIQKPFTPGTLLRRVREALDS
jgi:PAS domain S-box-containing protein